MRARSTSSRVIVGARSRTCEIHRCDAALRLRVLKIWPYALCSCLMDFIGVSDVDVTRVAAAEPWGTDNALDEATVHSAKSAAMTKRRFIVDDIIEVSDSRVRRVVCARATSDDGLLLRLY